MHVWSSHLSRARVNQGRLPILLVVSCTGKMNFSLSPFAPEYLISRNGFGSPVPRQPAHLHTQAEYGADLRDSSRVLRRRPFIYKSLTCTNCQKYFLRQLRHTLFRGKLCTKYVYMYERYGTVVTRLLQTVQSLPSATLWKLT